MWTVLFSHDLRVFSNLKIYFKPNFNNIVILGPTENSIEFKLDRSRKIPMKVLRRGRKTQKFKFCVGTQIKYVAHTGEK